LKIKNVEKNKKRKKRDQNKKRKKTFFTSMGDNVTNALRRYAVAA